MENEKKIYTANQMTGELLLGMVLYGVISYIIYKIIYTVVVQFFIDSENLILLGIFALAMESLMIFMTFKLANSKAFKNGTIYKSDVNNVLRNISFVIIVILIIQILGVFASVDSLVDNAIENDFQLKFTENLLSTIYDEDEMKIYQIEKEKTIQEEKNKIYKYMAVIEVCSATIYGIAIFLEKKSLYRRAE